MEVEVSNITAMISYKEENITLLAGEIERLKLRLQNIVEKLLVPRNILFISNPGLLN